MKQNFFTLLLLCFLTSAASAQVKFTIYNSKNSPLFDWPYSSIAFDKDGKLWTGNYMAGLYSFDGTTWEEYHDYDSDLIDDDINDLAIDGNNMLWIATDKGISMFDGGNFTNYDTNNTTMKGEAVYALAVDKENRIWAASSNGSFTFYGITVYDGTNWNNLTGYPSQIDHSKFAEFAFAANNDVWIASDPGITKYADSTFSFYPRAYTGLWSSNAVSIDNKGNIWAAGFDGILKYDGTNWTTIENETLGLGSNTLYSKILPEGDYLWLATSAGLLKYNTITQKIVETYNETNSLLESNSVIDIEKDAKGNMWLATGTGIAKVSFGETGIKSSSDFANKISVFPIPSQGIVNLEISALQGDFSAEVTDLSGRKFYSEDLAVNSYTNALNLSALSKGMYLLNIYNNGALVSTRKLILN